MQELISSVEISPFWISKCLSTFSVLLIYLSPACQTSFLTGEGLPFSISRDFQSQFCSLLFHSRWFLEWTSSRPVSLQDTEREKEKIVYFVLQTTIRCSGRGRRGTSWLNIGVASSFCRIIESNLCKWRLLWNLSHHCSLGSPPLWSPFQKLTPYQPCFRKSCQNLLHSRYNEISKSLCLCQAQLGGFFF